MMGTVPLRRLRSVVARVVEIVLCIAQTVARGRIHALWEPFAVRRNVVDSEVAERAAGRIRILDHEGEAAGALRDTGPLQRWHEIVAVPHML